MRAVGWVVLALAVAAAVAAQLPLQPFFLEPTLDNSFAAVLNHAAAQTAAGRPRLIGTYGPLGFAQFSLYLPETFGWILGVRAVLAAALCWALGWLGWAAWASPWGAAVLLLLGAPLLGIGDAQAFLLFALVAAIELVPGRAPPRPLRIILGIAFGVLAVTKVTFVIAGLVTLGPLALAALCQRRLPLTALIGLATVAASWLLLGFGWGEWVAYVDWSLREITPGYSQAMQLRSTRWMVWHAVGVSGALWIWLTTLAWRRVASGWWAPPLAYAGVLLLQFKAGFVRADIHVYVTAFALLLQGMALAALLGRRAAAVGALLVAALPGALLWHAFSAQGTPGSPAYRMVYPRDLVRRLAAVPAIASGVGVAPAHAVHVRDLRGMMAMPAFDGGVDMIGHWQSLLLANQSPYRPRPVFQSYMAYTPRLARENAAFLSSDAAPRWLLFNTDTIDGRFPALDDAQLWPLLLSLYQPAGGVGNFALLERRAVPRPWRLVPLGGADSFTDTAIDVPPADAGPIWARIDVEETAAERLTTLLFAAPYQYVDTISATNAVWRGRLVPAIARDGFLLSPVITNVPAFVALSTQGPQAIPNQAVRHIRIHVDSAFGVPAPPHRVHVDFSRLELE